MLHATDCYAESLYTQFNMSQFKSQFNQISGKKPNIFQLCLFWARTELMEKFNISGNNTWTQTMTVSNIRKYRG